MLGEFLKLLLILSCTSYTVSSENELENFRAFDDTTIYRLVWEKEQEALANEAESLETITMITSRKEKYTCSLPKMAETKQVNTSMLQFAEEMLHNRTVHHKRKEMYYINADGEERGKYNLAMNIAMNNFQVD